MAGTERIGLRYVSFMGVVAMVVAAHKVLQVIGTAYAECNSNEFSDVPDMEIEITTQGGKVLIFHEATYYMTNPDNAFYIRLVRGETILKGLTQMGNPSTPISIMYADDPGAGTHTYKVQWCRSGGGFFNTLISCMDSENNERSLVVIELII
jgi:hypothetical protein